MAQAVDCVKDGLPERKRDKWPCRAIANVNHQRCATDVNFLKLQTAASIRSDAPEIRIQGLLRRKVVPVNPESGDGVDHALQIVLGGFGACGCIGVT